MLSESLEINPKQYKFLRIRELTKTMWPGKLYKDENKTLKKLSISFGTTLLIEWLESPDISTFTGCHIYLAERNVKEKKNENIVSCFFDAGACPNIDQFYFFALQVLKKDWDLADVTLGKFKPQNFEWEVIKDPRPVEERGRLLKNKGNNTVQGIYNLKKQPVLLKDGDFISVRFDKQDGAIQDNFFCEDDVAARQEYLQRKQAKKPVRPARPEKAIKIGDF